MEPKKSRPKEKGLRGLSSKAYIIVLHLRSTTYKEVAVKLLKELNFNQPLENVAEETNVKRRVYDALNVLIAVGILHKEGRKIITKTDKCTPFSSHLEIELASIHKQLLIKEEAVREKQRKYEEIRTKLSRIKGLIERNRDSRTRASRVNQRIYFPFVGATNFKEWRVVLMA